MFLWSCHGVNRRFVENTATVIDDDRGFFLYFLSRLALGCSPTYLLVYICVCVIESRQGGSSLASKQLASKHDSVSQGRRGCE